MAANLGSGNFVGELSHRPTNAPTLNPALRTDMVGQRRMAI